MGRGDVLAQHLERHFVGRDGERSTLRSTLDPDGPAVVFVHGMAGIGKSALLEQFALEARGDGAHVLHIDCRGVSPTPSTLLEIVSGHRTVDVHEALSSLPADRASVIVLDHYEAFRLIDTWVRVDLATRLPDRVALILGMRGHPPAGWHAISAPAGAAPVVSLELGVLSAAESAALLAADGVPPAVAERLHHLTHGLPLALRIAGAAPDSASATPRMALSEVAGQLSEAYLDDVAPVVRETVDLLAITRRATPTLIGSLVPATTSATLLEVGRLPFVTVDGDGMRLHDAVRGPIAAELALTDPARRTRFLRGVWDDLTGRRENLSDDELWSWMADLLFLVDHPLVREAFFPSGVPQVAVTGAGDADLDAVLEIARQHLPVERVTHLEALVGDHGDHVYVARDDAGEVVAFSVVLDRAVLASDAGRRDPILRAVARQLKEDRLPVAQDVLVVYADLARDTGDGPSEPLAALYLDLKRSYLALHDRLARVYTVRQDPSAFLGHTGPLGFVDMGPVSVDGLEHRLVGLTFGPGSVDGWLTRLALRQFGPTDVGMALDESTRTVTIADHETALSPLEFGVLARLAAGAGEAVTRVELLRAVWGTDYSEGSNVVDAVVRSLRAKLREHSAAVATVRGRGYRLDRDALP